MATENSFDIVSDFDHQELVNAVDQALREIQTRYDLKDTKTTLELTKTELTITTANELALGSIRDVLQTKTLRRQLSLKIFDFGPPSDVSGARMRQVVTLRKGIDSDAAKKIAKLVRDQFPKIQPRIQGDTLRVSSKNRDDLQAVIAFLREQEESLDLPLQFTNYR
ncbi:MAG: YajQ family cyclic di-GMP-binding protein [Candidatus Viridilinea halotolerans]|uniref:Nucleotide-binding protein EI684_12530 n=1 Tax=Candidatus Viridilinea halotolerans TaxID=2491704 RepID=A0A426TY44_9CHLR|nr:MAG: YajQ family cyclic di-GMP-binding protein [Candidatus Viridilinea halotolerans]